MKKIIPIIKKLLCLIILIFTLASCSLQKNPIAYCFTMVFESNNDISKITLYCKTSDNSGSGEMKETTLECTGKNFYEAFRKISKENYELYPSSIIAYYFSDDLHQDEIKEISRILLTNTGYKTDNCIYSLKENISDADIYKEAQSICSNENIPRKKQNNYQPFLKEIRILCD